MLAVAILPNLYLLGGINFPSESFSSIYWRVSVTVIYGGGLLIPPVTALLVKRADIRYLPIVILNAIPIVGISHIRALVYAKGLLSHRKRTSKFLLISKRAFWGQDSTNLEAFRWGRSSF